MLSRHPILTSVCLTMWVVLLGGGLIGCGSSSTASEGGNGGSGPSPEPVRDVSARGEDGQVILSWGASQTGGARYNVYRSTSPSGLATMSTSTKLNRNPVDATTYRDSDVTNGTDYFYLVTAVDEAGRESDVSEEVVATPEREGETSQGRDATSQSEKLPEGVYARGRVIYPDTTAVSEATVLTDPSVQAIQADSLGRFQFTKSFTEDEYTFTAITNEGREGKTVVSTVVGDQIQEPVWIVVGTGKRSLKAISIDSVRANPEGPGRVRSGN